MHRSLLNSGVISRLALIAAVAGLLDGCTPTSGDDPLTNAEAAQAALTYFNKLQVSIIGQEVPENCTKWFAVANPVMTDKLVSGHTAKIKVNLDLTPSQYLQFQSPVEKCSQFIPIGAWPAGKTQTMEQEYHLEHWQNGWRVSDGTVK